MVANGRSLGDGPRIQADGSGESARAWFVVFALTLSYLFATLDRYLVGITLPAIKQDLSLSDTQLGILSGPAFSLAYCAISMPLGRLADLTNRCRLIAAGLIVWSLATAAMAFGDSFSSLLIARAMVGVGEGALLPAGTALIAAYFAPALVGRATGVFLSGSTFGKALAFIGGGALLGVLTAAGGLQMFHHFSPWQALFIVAAMPGFALAGLFLMLRDPGRARTRAQRPPLFEALVHLRRHRLVYGLHITYAACAFVANLVFISWAPTFYVRRFDLDPSTAAVLTGVATICGGPLGYLLGGAGLDWFRRRGIHNAPARLVGLSLLVALPGTALLTLSDTLLTSVVGYGLAQIATTMATVPVTVGVQMLTPPQHRSLLVGAQSTVIALVPMAVGPTVVGVVNDQLFAGANLGLSMLVVVAASSVPGLVCVAAALPRFGRAVADVDGGT